MSITKRKEKHVNQCNISILGRGSLHVTPVEQPLCQESREPASPRYGNTDNFEVHLLAFCTISVCFSRRNMFSYIPGPVFFFFD